MTMLMVVLVLVTMLIPVGDDDGGDGNEMTVVMEMEWGECGDMVVEVEGDVLLDLVLVCGV